MKIMSPIQPSINYFQIIGKVINTNIEIIAKQMGISLEMANAKVLDYLTENSDEWNSKTRPQIRYDDPLCRIAYLYSNVPANANLIEIIFKEDLEIEQYLDQIQSEKGEVKICAVGGGPGTELLGLCKRIERRHLNDQIYLDFSLIDKVNEWLFSWKALKRHISERFGSTYGKKSNWPITPTGDFMRHDIDNFDALSDWEPIFGQDISIMCYVISEIFEDFRGLHALTSIIAEHAPKGAKFLFIDRNDGKWESEIRVVAHKSNLVLSEFRYHKSKMDSDEEKNDLGTIFSEMAKLGRHPRLGWDAFWVIGTKL